LGRFEVGLRDRFGPIPTQVIELIDTIRLRWLGMDIGLERVVLKNGKMVGYFIQNKNSAYYQSEPFTKVLKYIQANSGASKMKEANNKLTLTFEKVTSVKEAIGKLTPVASC